MTAQLDSINRIYLYTKKEEVAELTNVDEKLRTERLCEVEKVKCFTVPVTLLTFLPWETNLSNDYRMS